MTHFESWALVLAFRIKSLSSVKSLSLALKVKSSALFLTLRVKSLALTLKVQFLIATLAVIRDIHESNR